jgi:dTDP-4-dehydrorhamnose reductase
MSHKPDPIIVGGGGMLAHAVGHEITTRGGRALALDSQTCDITDPSAVERLFEQQRPSLLINCAAYTNVDRCELEPQRAEAVNGHGVGHLASAAKRYGTKLVHISTDFVFDGTATTPYRPDHPTNPLSAYGRSKLLGERLLKDIDPPGWLVVRTAWLYGPHGNCFPQTMLNAARAGKLLRVVSDQTGTPTFTYDLARILLDLVDRDATGIYHGANIGQTNWYEFTRTILTTFGVPADVTPISSAEWKAARPQSAVRPAYSVLDTTATARTIGRSIADWHDAFSRYVTLVNADTGTG